MRTTETRFRPDIEGMRAVAVLMVLAYHADVGGLHGGFVGVDVFFVLSGYLITGILVREARRSGTIRLREFYARRIRRLLPALLVVLCATIVAARVLLPPTEQTSVAVTTLATLTYLSNVYFVHVSSDYFSAGSAGNPLLHMWSLAVEEQFYLFWPLLLLGVLRVAKRKTWARGLLWTIAAAGLVSFASCLWLTTAQPAKAFFLVYPRAWEFAAGALASEVSLSSKRWRTLVGWAGLATLIVAGFRVSAIGFPGAAALWPVLGTAAFLVAGLDAESGTATWQANRVLGAPVLLWIGRRSYSLYLWHWPLLVFAGVFTAAPSVWIRLLCLGCAFALAAATYTLVEDPVRHQHYLRTHAGLCIAGSMAVIVVGVGAMLGWRAWARHTPEYKVYGAALQDLPEDARLGCEDAFGESAPRQCVFGIASANKTVLLFGDSHIEQWLPAFQDIAVRDKWRIVLIVKSSCPGVAIPTWNPQSGKQDTSCRAWRDLALGEVERLHPQLVVMSNFSGYTEGGGPDLGPDGMLPFLTWQSGAAATFSRLHAAGVPVIFLRDTPWARFDATQCLARDNWRGTHRCAALERGTALNEGIFRAVQQGAQENEVSFIDLSDSICGPVLCPLTRGRTIVYRDSGHLTATFLRSLSADLERAILRVAPALKEPSS